MANYKKWTESELSFLRDNHTIMNDIELGTKLSQITGQNISTAMIRRQRRKLNIKKNRGRPKKSGAISNNGEQTLINS